MQLPTIWQAEKWMLICSDLYIYFILTSIYLLYFVNCKANSSANITYIIGNSLKNKIGYFYQYIEKNY
nr:MAG TPA: hypothetical protein [Caudoviricetes sp.]